VYITYTICRVVAKPYLKHDRILNIITIYVTSYCRYWEDIDYIYIA